MQNFLLNMVLSIPGILLALTMHQFAQGYVAYKLGDNTAKHQNRLTLNPTAHIEPIGFLTLLIFGFGWSKPITVNSRNFKNPKKDRFKVSIAGVVGNLLTGLVFALLFRFLSDYLFNFVNSVNTLNLVRIINTIILQVAVINFSFGLFNLIPIPPMAGFNIVSTYFPKLALKYGNQLYQYQMFILLILIMPIFGGRSIINLVLSPLVGGLIEIFAGIQIM